LSSVQVKASEAQLDLRSNRLMTKAASNKKISSRED